MRKSKAKRRAERELRQLTDEIRWDIQKVLKDKHDKLLSDGEAKELLFVRATRDALKGELRVARLASFLGTGYGAYVDFLASKSD